MIDVKRIKRALMQMPMSHQIAKDILFLCDYYLKNEEKREIRSRKTQTGGTGKQLHGNAPKSK
jgi:hypothetical protein